MDENDERPGELVHCVCGHGADKHTTVLGWCIAWDDGRGFGHGKLCRCMGFEEATEPDTPLGLLGRLRKLVRR